MSAPAAYLLDTNVLSETRKTRPDPRIMAFLAATGADALFLSALTIGELRKGAAARRRTDAVAADQLTAWIDRIETTFADRVLPIDAAAARIWGELAAVRSLPVIDTLIAATALSRSLTLATRNVTDVLDTGALLIDPWKEP